MKTPKDRAVPPCPTCGTLHIGPHCPGTFSPSKEPHKLAENQAAYVKWCDDEDAEAGITPPSHVRRRTETTAAPAPEAETAHASTPRAPTAADVLYGFLQSASAGRVTPANASIADYAAQLAGSIGVEVNVVDSAGIAFLPDGSAFVSLEGRGTFFVRKATSFK